MKKTFNSILICCIMALVLTFSLASCNKSCEHVYDDCADIECNLCGETRDSMHSWKDADCVTPKTCTVCQKTDGEALGHEWTTPDVDQCEVQSTCSRCGATEGHNKEHTYDNECDTTCNTCGKARATEHTPNADDGDCTTAITCSVCGDVTTAGKAQHVAHTDDGDCTTTVTCTECSTVITAAKSHDFSGAWENDASGHWHVCKNDGCSVTDTKADHTSDGAATEEKAEKCTVCEYVITPELEHTHNHNIPKYDTENHWIECACGDKSAVTAHTANNDDGDCTTAVTCSGCAHIMTAAKAHTPNADDGDCTTDITCKDCSKVTTAGNKEHTPNADDGDCTTAITCQYCDVVTTEARNEHTGGTPTCTHGKLCEVCGVEYDTTKNPDNHVFIDGVCACGELQTIDATEMTAEQLNAAVAELLASGVADITIKMSADADMDMFTALRTALAESTAPDGSINLTISGAKTIPDEGFIDMLDYFENDDKNIAGDKLKSLTLTDVETIGEYAFSACTNLEAVNMPKVVTIGECAFNEWRKGTKLTSLDLPNATTIGDCAFAYSSLLTSVNLPKVVTIGLQAFDRCDIRTLDLPEVTEIGGMAFVDNYNLVSCSAPKATKIGAYPWGNCSKLETLELTAAGDITISNNYFANTLTGQINLVLNKDKESQVTQNDDGTATWNIKDGYGNFYTFKSITFACSDGTTNHDYQYSDNGDGTHDVVCSKCGYVKVDNEKHTAVPDGYDCICGATIIAVIDGTLGGKTTATDDDVNALVEQFKYYVDNGITTIIVPGTDHAMYDSVMGTIPAYAEALYLLVDENDQSPYCGTIDLILPDATEIVDHAFDNAFALKSITLPKVTTVGDGAFYGCTYLRTMTFGSVVTTIIQNERVVFYYVGEEVGGCDLVLNCGQMNSTYIPDLTANTWYDDNNKYFKSITLTHTGECDECKALH